LHAHSETAEKMLTNKQLTWMCQTSKRITRSMKYVAAFYLGRWYIGRVMNDNDSTNVDLIVLQQRKQMFQWQSGADIL